MNIRRSKIFISTFLTLIFFLLVVNTVPVFATGSFFNPEMNLDNSADHLSVEPKMVVDGTNVYIIWTDIDFNTGEVDIFFTRSTDGGDNFDTPTNLSNSPGVSQLPDLSVDGNNVYVMWQEEDPTFFTNDIFFTKSADGINFDPPVNLSNDGVSFSPKITSSTNIVHVVWVDASSSFSVINYMKSQDGGVNFDTPIGLSDNTLNSGNPQIVTEAGNPLVVWQSDVSPNDIIFARSADGGDNFDIPINLSNTIDDSANPKILVDSGVIHVVWEEASNSDIMYTKSITSPISFDPPINLSNTPDASFFPSLAASGSNVYIAWQDGLPGTDEIDFTRSTDGGDNFDTPINLSNNAGASQSAKVATSANNVYAIWQDDSIGGVPDIFFRVSSDNGATFGGTNNLSNNLGISINPQLALSGTDIYTAWEDDAYNPGADDVLFRRGSATPLDITFDANQYKLVQTAEINVIDAPDPDPSNIDSISVDVISSSDSSGITVSLTETDINTGNYAGTITFTSGASAGTALHAEVGDTLTTSFGGQDGFASIFPRTINFDFLFYSIDKSPVITVNDQNSNLDTISQENISVDIISTSDLGGITVILTETGDDTGLFTGAITFTSGTSGGNALQAKTGDTITATFMGKIATASIIPGVGPGGSGGGLLPSPGVVLDFTGGSYFASSFSSLLGINSDPSQPILPSEDTSKEYPFSIDNKGFALSSLSNTILTQTKTTDVPVRLKFVIFDPYEIEHFAVYTNLSDSSNGIEDSDTYIIYHKNKPLEIVDKNNLLSSATVSSSKNGDKQTFVFEVIFAKPMQKSGVIYNVWDIMRSPARVKINDALEVVESSVKTDSSLSKPSEIVKTEPSIILTSIKDWSGFSSQSISDSELLSKIGINAEHIPTWFKKIGQWTANGQVSENEFITAVHYLYEKGIVK